MAILTYQRVPSQVFLTVAQCVHVRLELLYDCYTYLYIPFNFFLLMSLLGYILITQNGMLMYHMLGRDKDSQCRQSFCWMMMSSQFWWTLVRFLPGLLMVHFCNTLFAHSFFMDSLPILISKDWPLEKWLWTL